MLFACYRSWGQCIYVGLLFDCMSHKSVSSIRCLRHVCIMLCTVICVTATVATCNMHPDSGHYAANLALLIYSCSLRICRSWNEVHLANTMQTGHCEDCNIGIASQTCRCYTSRAEFTNFVKTLENLWCKQEKCKAL